MDSDAKHVAKILRKVIVILHDGFANGRARDDIARDLSVVVCELDRGLGTPPKRTAFQETMADVSLPADDSPELERWVWNKCVDACHDLRPQSTNPLVRTHQIESLREPDDDKHQP